MPDTNDYLSQLLARVDKKLSDSEAGDKPSSPAAPEPSEPAEQKVFTSGGRFDDVPYAGQPEEETKPSAPALKVEPEEETPAPSTEPEVREELEYAQEAPEEAHPQTVQRDLEKTVKKTFTFASDSETAAQPGDEPGNETEDIFDWNVSEDVEKYLSSGDGSTIFDKMTAPAEKKTGRAIRAERRLFKENTRQLMDSNSEERRGCFGTFFHIIFILLLVAFTVLAVLYVLQTIAGITIIDINSILASATAEITDLINSFKK
ncbi:MAG: hypothetical protein IKX72_01720 [Oscillospiraceae bacterium]|nr:hypothetical protein [Oscillospiraceae bacterium]